MTDDSDNTDDIEFDPFTPNPTAEKRRHLHRMAELTNSPIVPVTFDTEENGE